MRHLDRDSTADFKGFNWHILATIWPYLSDHKWRIALAIACLIAAKGANVLSPFILKDIVDHLDIQRGSALEMASMPLALVLAFGMAKFSNVLFSELRDTVFGRVTERAMRRIGLKVFQHLHQLDLEFHLNRRTGGLSRDIERGTTGISFLMRFFVFNIFPTLIEILMIAALLFINYGFLFSLITLGSVAIYIIYSIMATEWRTRFVREANQADSVSNTRAVDSLLNYETVKYFNNEEYEAERYDQALEKWESARRKNRLSLFTLNGGQALIIAVAQTLMIGLAAKEVSEGTMTLGDFTLINAFMLQLFLPLNFLGFVYREIKSSMANIEQMFELILKKPNVQDIDNAPELIVSQGRIQFDDVHFAYHPNRPILQGINFSVEPGEKIAVVGASGSGKSTLVKLLFRFYDINLGSIHIDNQDISRVSQQSLRQAVGVVPQDTVLFNDSIIENVRYGRPNASPADIERACEMAHLGEFINSLPDGYNTAVGERGLKLSGGEKQRVAIARTILKNPPILAFDEATSSLDSRSEQAILNALQEVAKGHSSLVIAHRLSTIVDADRILVLDHGKIIEQGNHQTLLEKQGHYAKLWQLQQSEQSN
ncbi:MAG: ATP-binding cassette subfamily B protein [Pseudohongiellaceae bacterium]|jgi:ATP-binding cassette subfamily B protein